MTVSAAPTPAIPSVSGGPDEIEWKLRLGETVAHAFSSGPGWMRSVCRAERWTVALEGAPGDTARCSACALLEISESELRLLDGNR